MLPFRVDYVSTFKEVENIENKKVRDIDREAALKSPQRIENIVKYILEHFDQKTKRNIYYNLNDRRLAGFNSIFAVDSIEMAILYYARFKKQQAQLSSEKRLRVAMIYSFGANDEAIDGIIDENPEDTSGLDKSARDFLEQAIQDYNTMFGTTYDTSSDKFQNYYKDLSKRLKNREIDILLVVNMFLTGFDATTLNTLWVDKNLRYHGLLQAYSRTNRILNTVKTFGNIVCFRNLEEDTNEAIALFGNKEASGIILLRTFQDYYNGYEENDKKVQGYVELVQKLREKFPASQWIDDQQSQKEFIQLYGSFLRMRNLLQSFDEFEGKEILSEREVQDYQGTYITLHEIYRKKQDVEKEYINDDLVFEMELIRQVEINIDYILELVKKYYEDHTQGNEIMVDIRKTISSSVNLRNKKELIEQFIGTLSSNSDIDSEWEAFVKKKQKEDLEKIIQEEQLDEKETYKFMYNAFRSGRVSTLGTELISILPPMSRFTPNSERKEKKARVLEKLLQFFDRYFDISSGRDLIAD